MNKFETTVNRYWPMICLVLTILIFFNTCGNPNRVTNRRLDALTNRIDSLAAIVATTKELRIEGLKSELRMIQATDRKILDVERQNSIEKEIKSLEE